MTTFESEKFAEGRFRNAYMGTWTSPPSKAGKKCVVKEKKDEYTWEAADWDMALKTQAKAQQLATAFNSANKTNYPISFADISRQIVITQEAGSSGPQKDEYVIVEDYISGEFKKWCNNYGFISAEAETTCVSMPAFMHWSWLHTGGKVMVSDLQGVRQDYPSKQYRLTDAAILSSTREYGPTDMGIEGMAMFFLHHKCNAICQGLSRPTIQNLRGKIPDHVLQNCVQLLQQVLSATTYQHELKFPPRVRQIVTQTFQSIATGQRQ